MIFTQDNKEILDEGEVEEIHHHLHPHHQELDRREDEEDGEDPHGSI